MKIRKWICKHFGHVGFTRIDNILVDMAMIEIKNMGKTDTTIKCSRCKQKISIQKIYDLTHDGVKRANKEIIKLSEVE
ncbi:MAG: hypothetical protein WC495_06950 [Patescibacteria group bacterium]|jgi:hypothetical protein